MEYYKKIKPLAIIALVITTLIFLWQLASYISSISTYINHSQGISLKVYLVNTFSSMMRFFITYVLLYIFNIMVLTKQKNKTLMLLAITFSLVLITTQTVNSFNTIVTNAVFLNQGLNNFQVILFGLGKFALNLSLLVICILQFNPFIKFFKEETAQ